MRALVAAKQRAAHQEAIKWYEKARTKGRPKIPEPGNEVLYCCEADLRKEGKQAAIRYFGPYTVVETLDEAHCSIQLIGDPHAKPERVHYKQLVHCRDKFTVPIYPNQDWTRRVPNPQAKKPLFKTDEIPKHGYNTRSKAQVEPPIASAPNVVTRSGAER